MHDESHASPILTVDGVLKSRHERYYHDCAPVLVLAVSSNDTLNKGVTYGVLDFGALNLGAAHKELVLDVDKVIRLLDYLDVGVQNAVLNTIGCSHRPHTA